jgi:glycosyltransferase involved in cell wall biosynthesis
VTASSASHARAPAVVHVSPTFFGTDSVVGGGERYAEDLSKAVSQRVPVRFVSFGARGCRERVSEHYERVILRSWTRDKMTPFSPRLWRELRGAAAIHCFQFNVLPTFLSALFGRVNRIPTFVSDLGGGGWTPGYQIDVGRWISGHLPISQYAAARIPRGHKNSGVIYGGVDLAKYPSRKELQHDGSVVFLGRIMKHKGVHLLIESLPTDRALRVIGPCADADYLRRLKQLATGKRVEFLHGLTDAQVAAELRKAAVLVHPTPTDVDGNAGVNELLGLAVLEAMASNCPVIVSNAASLPELIVPDVSGLLVPPNDPGAIRQAIQRIIGDSMLWCRMALEARRRVELEFVWPRVVNRCLHAYGISNAEALPGG